MSAIGRVFIVLNLVLAGAFVGFAGTFLQRHTDYKVRYEQTTADLEKANTSHQATLLAKEGELQTAIRELDNLKREFDNSQTARQGLETENQRLQAQLADLASDVKTLTSQTTAMAQTIEQASQQSRDAYEKMLAAENDKNEALSQREEAQQGLSEAQRQIADLQNQLADGKSQIAQLSSDNQEKDLIISTFQTRFPGAVGLAQPNLAGVVHSVQPGGRIMTVRLTDNPGNVEVKPGYTFAVYDDQKYKGEAVITSVNGDFAFCKITNAVQGASIREGDRAATNIGE